MRAALFLSALALSDALGYVSENDIGGLLVGLLVAFFSMDILELIARWRGR